MLETGAVGFLQKPYRLAALSQKIAAMLGHYPKTAPEAAPQTAARQ